MPEPGNLAEALYEKLAREELRIWLQQTKKKPSLVNRFTSGTQRSINNLIPEKIHQAITFAIEKIVKGVLIGNEFVRPKPYLVELLRLKEYKARQAIRLYKRTASVEGAITGAGGILMGFADLPAFLAIKMKMLFDLAAAYGHDVRDFKERVFILTIFKLTFSSQKTRNTTVLLLENWTETAEKLPDNFDGFDWRSFQLEYRDYMDLAKLAQLIPVIGAGVGAVANFKLTEQLGKTAIQAYRLRYFAEKSPAR
ncbi:EcsC protein family protein [Cyclobacterium xiamenense]|uniref:EcsC protein family protein n=1 Tax=Cyclobacterium xiamenense TaxID=1297121 RepID=A0A1H6VU71_9BACT|nr:EcsC family protein [Cyclobacterium xiamenense]SEJ08228.1 EcsC protein family protein [Cyclobacterium xiamenense]